MNRLQKHPIDETLAEERQALRLRERDETYRAIGKALGVSSGKAHHLVRAAHQRALEDAYEVTRPPGKTGDRTPERASQLYDRLGLDVRRLHRVIKNHVDLNGEDATHSLIRGRVAAIDVDFAEGFGRLADRLAALDGSKTQGMKRSGADTGLCRSVARSFAELLGAAAEVDPVLEENYWQEFIRAVFGRDLAELAEILGLECPPAPPPPDSEPGLRPGDEPEPPAVALDAEARRRRNERIVTARVGGASLAEIARAEGLSRRQIRRIMAEHRSGRRMASPAALEAMNEAVAAMRRDLRLIDERIEETDDSATRIGLANQRLGLVGGHVSVLREGGWLSPESVAQALKDAPLVDELREQFAHEANRRLRQLLEAHDVGAELIERAQDQIIIAAGLGDRLPVEWADNVQA